MAINFAMNLILQAKKVAKVKTSMKNLIGKKTKIITMRYTKTKRIILILYIQILKRKRLNYQMY